VLVAGLGTLTTAPRPKAWITDRDPRATTSVPAREARTPALVPRRVRLIDWLDQEGERTVGALAEALDERLHNVSQHLAVLRSAGAVTRRHHGREAFYQLSDPAAMLVYEQVAAGLLAESARLGRLVNRRE
jgi:DNA-binding transcriptional ArsR family regulator